MTRGITKGGEGGGCVCAQDVITLVWVNWQNGRHSKLELCKWWGIAILHFFSQSPSYGWLPYALLQELKALNHSVQKVYECPKESEQSTHIFLVGEFNIE